jgi:glycosyltransferase involved in cell wall biosynthesis
MAREPKIAYVLLRNAHFGPRLASSVELCVRDLALYSRHSESILVVCPAVDKPFDGVEIATVPKGSIGGNLGKALAVARLLLRRGVDFAIVENHLPAAALIALASGIPTILHSHAYERAPPNAFRRVVRDCELKLLAGLVLVSEDCVNQFRANFPEACAPIRAVPNGLDMTGWSWKAPKDKTILSVGRALDDKGHIEAMAALIRVLPSRPEWSARFILSTADQEPQVLHALREAARPFSGRITIDLSLPYADVRKAWETAAIGMALTKTPEPFGRTALEALASGAALVTSGRGGLVEVCGPDALIVDPSDTDEVAGSLAVLMDGPDRRSYLAGAGRARAEKLFDIRAVAKRMDDFIEEALERSVDRRLASSDKTHD